MTRPSTPPPVRPARRPVARRPIARWAVGALGLGLLGVPLAVVPAAASSTGLVISEVYGGGGNAGASYSADFIELHNTSGAPIALGGMSVQYRSATGTTSQVTALSGSIAAGGRWLVQESGGATGAALPTPDTTGSVNLSGTSGVVVLSSTTTATAPGDASAVDVVGYGTTTSFEGSGAAPTLTSSTSASRSAAGTDTNDNKADFTAGAPAPQNAGSAPTEPPPPPPAAVARTIEQIQGSGAASPYAGTSAVTEGVVTAAYPTGGFNGFYLQTAGTGGAVDLASHDTSDGLFVYLGTAPATAYPAVGDHVEVTGAVSEFGGMTQLTAATGGVRALATPAAAPAPATVVYPSTTASRESVEGMLLAPQGDYTVTDNYTLNQYAEIGLARGTTTLRQPTDVARPGSPEAAAVAADNAAREVTLDDGATANFLGAARSTPLPYLTRDRSLRVGAAATFTRPVIADFRNNAWKLQPTRQLTADDAAEVQPASFADTRTAAPAAVGGDLKLASFNVLNYFTETGEDFVADGGTCSYYTDRAGARVTVNSCNLNGPRGAADDVNLARQQAKIVAAINTLDADVLSLEEIENSAQYAGPDRRDDALRTLVAALNTAAGSQRWAFVPSPAPADRPAVTDEDVIRTAFIYQPAAVEAVGASSILQSPAFGNARDPLAQEFRPAGGSDAQDFVVIVNHFKSKGSGIDDGTGQGNANPDRVAQAKALVAFADDQKTRAGTDSVFLTGDFNAYTHEDPLQVLYDAGYTDIGEAQAAEESTYLFDGLVGSLDHVLANGAAYAQVTGAHVWNINSVESVAYEYSRYNNNPVDFYAATPYRSSDHDPLLVGFDVPAPVATTTTASVSPTPVVVRDTTPTVTATVTGEDGATVDGGTVTVSAGTTLLGSAPVSGGTAQVRVPEFEAVGPRTLTVAYSGSGSQLPSQTAVVVDVVKATPTMTVAVQPTAIYKRSTSPRLVVDLSAPGQTVTGYVTVRQDGAILALEPLAAGRATLTLPPYKKQGQQTVTVSYLGSDLAEAVDRQVTFTVRN